MAAISNQSLIASLEWRYATKAFDANKKISADDWKALESCLILSPSSFGLQPWKFLVVESKDIRNQLKSVSWNQSQITDASHLVVLCVQKDLSAVQVEQHIQRIADVRAISADTLADYKGMMLNFIGAAPEKFDVNAWSARQVYIALGVFLTSAAVLGIDACPMEGLDPAEYNRILGLDSQNLKALAVVAAGYRSENDSYAKAKKVRYPASNIVQHI